MRAIRGRILRARIFPEYSPMPSPRLPSLLASTLAALLAWTSPGGAVEISYIGRVGFYDAPEFMSSYNGEQTSYAGMNPGYILGTSREYSGPYAAGIAYWIADFATATTTRVGLGPSESTGTGADFGDLLGWANHFVYGYSVRNNSQAGQIDALWFTDVATRATTRIGLYSDSEFIGAKGQQYSRFTTWPTDEESYLTGISRRYNGAIDAGQAAWIANAATGVTMRIGLFNTPEFTSTSTNEQTSEATAVSRDGIAIGSSARFGESGQIGQAAWYANAATSVTTRIGFSSGPEFTNASDGTQFSAATLLNARNYAVGYSTRFNGSSVNGQAAWVADTATGVTTRIGLLSGAEFTSSTGDTQSSTASGITGSGLITGVSDRYNGASSAGQAAWMADAATGATTRIGLFSGAEFTSSSTGWQYSSIHSASESGFVTGSSSRFSGSASAGEAAWVAEVGSGTSRRIGLYNEAEFTSSSGVATSTIETLTESGIVAGYSTTYNGSTESGRAAWVASASSGDTARIGLYTGDEFTGFADNQRSTTISQVTESGHIIGTSQRYNGTETAGQAAWMADAAKGATTRIGLYSEPAFTSATAKQSSTPLLVTASGYVVGTSELYVPDSLDDTGQATWVADTSTGQTTRIGLADAIHTRQDQYQYSATEHIEGGLISGYSYLYNGEAGTGQTAWVFNAITGVQVSFDLSSDPNDGRSFSSISGITNGFVYGSYIDYANATGFRAFLWREDLGVIRLNDVFSDLIAETDWALFFSAISDGIYILGGGQLDSTTGLREAVYVAQIVPEPGPAALVLAGLLLAAAQLHLRKRRAGLA